jgi:hypothetical protein
MNQCPKCKVKGRNLYDCLLCAIAFCAKCAMFHEHKTNIRYLEDNK